MYVSFEDIRTFDVVGRDAEGVLGTLHDAYVDTRDWRVTWLVLESGGWFASNKVLIGTDHRVAFDTAGRRLVTDLARYDIETAPEAGSVRTAGELGADDDGASGPRLFLAGRGGAALPFGFRHRGAALVPDADAGSTPPTEEERHLRSAREVIGYALAGRDGEVGPVRDLLIDADAPEVAWLSVDTGSWLAGHEVVIRPHWAREISWRERRIDVDLVRAQVRGAPPLDSLDGLDRAYASSLARFYRLPPF